MSSFSRVYFHFVKDIPRVEELHWNMWRVTHYDASIHLKRKKENQYRVVSRRLFYASIYFF